MEFGYSCYLIQVFGVCGSNFMMECWSSGGQSTSYKLMCLFGIDMQFGFRLYMFSVVA